MSVPRRTWLRRALAVLTSSVAGNTWLLIARAHAQGSSERVIEIVAQRFEYKPNIITLKRGQPVTLAFRALDFPHGFHAPDFGVRADLVPGQVVTVRLLPAVTGRFEFLCDNFCGDGHEGMNGHIIVQD